MAETAPVVYIVDDDPELLESVLWLLGSIGIDAVPLDSGQAFLDAYDGEHPALLILDVRMPVMSGTRLQEILNDQWPWIAVIFVSAHGDIKMSVRSMRRGAIDFLEKPYESQYMLDVVQAGLRTAAERFAAHREREDVATKLGTLTPREMEILRLVVAGLPSQNIARRLEMSVKTVDVHRARIKAKTGADSINTLVRDILLHGVDLGE